MLRFRAARRSRVSYRRRLGGAVGIRHGLVRAEWDHDPLHAAAVSIRADRGPAIAGQRARSVSVGKWSDGAAYGAESEFGARPGRVWRKPKPGFGIFAAVEFHASENVRTEPELRSRLSRVEKYALGSTRREYQPASGPASAAGTGAPHVGRQPIFRADSSFVHDRRSDDHRAAIAAALSSLHGGGAVPQ